ncbi:TPA: ArsA family ATPase [Candidatus Bathyarchaeota archaeon]|nr:ArsA family ATPase [Candidatus Bathyarchaeota archaeon]
MPLKIRIQFYFPPQVKKFYNLKLNFFWCSLLEFKGLSYLDLEKPKLMIFCGKGGVGKTTCATATALHFARKGFKTLLISTDPTPSLSDILEVYVKGQITDVKFVERLSAIELDYELILKRWRERFGGEVYEVISSFLPVGEEIIDYIAGAPGLDEEFSLSYVLDLYESKNYDTIVWDTAPAGGTLSLLRLQDRFYRHLGEAARLYFRVRKAIEVLTKGTVKRDPISIISKWEQLVQRVFNMLKDEKTHTIIVTIAEALGVRMTERMLKEVEAFGMRVSKILVNYIITEDMCMCDFHRERAAMQKHYLEILKNMRGESMLSILPQLPREVKGAKAVEKIEELLF